MSYIYCGIDPGLSGALAFLDADESTLVIETMPIFEKNSTKHTDAEKLSDILEKYKPNKVILEAVFSSPQMGVSSSFSFGRSKGIIEGACAATKPRPELILVTPSIWKKNLSVTADKKQTLLRATQLMPECSHMWKRQCDDGKAEAALLTIYGALKIGAKLKKIVPRS